MPRSTAEVSRILKFCSENGIKVVARGAGTSLCGGALPTEDCIVLGLSRMNRILDVNFEHPFWNTIHQKCLACGTCTYLCPTCHCFDISDEVKKNDGIRLRNWDSCMFPLFTKETSGHNPRTSQKERWRQRAMHKFKYFVDNFNAIACVGCGRCVMYCPVNIDIRKIVEDISKL